MAYRETSMLARSLLLVALVAAPAAADSNDPTAGLPIAPGKDERRAVLELMKQNTEKYGGDIALLQGLLLVHSLQGEAVLTTESRIVGFEKSEGRNYVACHVASGVVLNDRQQLTREQRLERIWHIVLERALAKYQNFSAPADGVAIEIQYNHRAFETISEVGKSDDVGPVERAKFYLATADLRDYLSQRVGPQEFLERSRILLDDQPVKLRLVEVTMPPPPKKEAPSPASGDSRSAKL